MRSIAATANACRESNGARSDEHRRHERRWSPGIATWHDSPDCPSGQPKHVYPSRSRQCAPNRAAAETGGCHAKSYTIRQLLVAPLPPYGSSFATHRKTREVPLRIVRLQIQRFRSVRSATLFPAIHNVYLGPNNVGKTAVLEALNLLLNPELGGRGPVVDENDFYCREYRLSTSSTSPSTPANAAPAAPSADVPSGTASGRTEPADNTTWG